MARQKHSSNYSRVDKKGENDAKTQISLEQGSGEYKEFVMDRQGMDEFDQEKYLAEAAGHVKADDFSKDDAWHADEAAEAAAANPERDEIHRSRQKFHYDHTVERKQNRRILKTLLIDDVEADAIEIAEATPDTDDDKQAETIRRRLPKLIHDDGVMVDEFVPTALEKYM